MTRMAIHGTDILNEDWVIEKRRGEEYVLKW